MKVNGVLVKNESNYATYCSWLGRQFTGGVALASYKCPHCKTPLYTIAPENGGVSDSLSNCPVCDGVYFKVVSNFDYQLVVELAIHQEKAQ